MTIRALYVFSVAVLLSVAGGCDSFVDLSTQKKSPLVGSWTCRDGPLVTRFQFRPDGTCTRSLVVPTGPEKTEGTWSMEDDGVTLDLSLSNGSPDPEKEYHTVHIDGKRMFFADQKGMPAFVRND